MRKISERKIKVKGLIIIGILVFFIAYLSIDNSFLALAKYYSRQGDNERSLAYYDKVIKYFPKSDSMPEALYWSALKIQGSAGIGRNEGNILYIFPDMVGGNAAEINCDVNLDTAEERYQKLLAEYSEHILTTHVLNRLAEVYLKKGDLAKAERYYLQALNTQTDWHAGEAGSELAKLYLRQGKPERTLEILQKMRENNLSADDVELLLVEGDAYAYLGESEKAREIYERVVPTLEERFAEEKNNGIEEPEDIKNNMLNDYRERVAQKLKDIEVLAENTGYASIEGKVVIGKQNPGDLLVLLRPRGDSFLPMSPEKFWRTAQVSADGSYSFKKVPAGEYELGVALPTSILEGAGSGVDYVLQKKESDDFIILNGGETVQKNLIFVPTVKLVSPEKGKLFDGQVILQWEPYQGSSYYKIIIGKMSKNEKGEVTSLYSTTLPDKISATSYTLSLEQLDNISLGLSWGEKGIEPSSVLGLRYSHNDLFWGVAAYNGEGVMISNSEGYKFHYDKSSLQWLKIPQKELVKADKLFLDYKYQEAIAAYEEDLKNNPNNVHALRVLAVLYEMGYRYDEDKKIGVNYDKAEEYYNRLFQITGNEIYKNKIINK